MRASRSENEQAFAALADVLAGIGEADEMRPFLREILTPGEIRDITLRWRLLELLAEGVPQRRISEELKVSLCKITRGSKIMKQRGSVASRVIRGRRADERGRTTCR